MTTTPGELFPLDQALRGIRERFADAVLDADRSSLREHVVVLPAERLADVAAAIALEWGGQLIQLFGVDESRPHGRLRLHAMFSMAPEDAVLTLVAAVPADLPAYPSLTPRLPAAAWLERELHDMLGVTAVGHPDPRPLVLHEGWPRGTHPLRRDFVPPPDAAWPPRLSPSPAHRAGAYEIPVGPIHAGIIEPGHFRFATGGENVLAVDAKLGWQWRGLEKLAEGQGLGRGLELAERTCGTCAFSHALAFCQAAEEATGITVPPRARALRTVAAELERLVNHVNDLAIVFNDVAWVVGFARMLRLKEELQRAVGALFGHRFLRAVCVPGGVARDLDDAQQLWLRRVLGDVRAETQDLLRIARANSSVVDRLVATGTLPADVARALGATGVAARASGLGRDARRDHPYAFYRELDFQVAGRSEGDVMARVLVRSDEITESLNLVDQLVLRLPGGPLAHHVGEPPAQRWGLGLVESPRGLLSHWIRFGDTGEISDWRVRSASHANWPAVTVAACDGIVPDFPLVNRSFNLCYACCDK
jgi:Ni,Fe-hydrogenase III large subunit/Ni,Fe-hydrogenase III component G